MVKCPFCQSENIEQFNYNSFNNQKTFPFIKREGNRTTEGTFCLFFEEYFCLDCGMAFKKASDKNLKDYKEMKPYFK